VASKILEKLPDHFETAGPQDGSATTLVLFGTMAGMTDHALRPHFASFGDIDSIRIIAGSDCAFVKFADRQPAEAALERFSKTGLRVSDVSFRIAWAKAKKK
jgi:hypothetical protein